MTTTFATDNNNDLFLGPGKNIVVINGLPAIIAAAETATKAQLGEMILSVNQGIPNFQTVWTGSPNYALYTDFMRTTLMAVPGVQAVVSLEIKIQNNVLQYRATLKTQFGIGEING